MTGLVEAVAPRYPDRSALDDDLVARARSGDSVAFEQLVGPKVDGLYRTAVGIMASEADARDAMQEAVLSAWRRLSQLRDATRFDPWLTSILINTCRMQLRRRRRIREVPLEGTDRSSGPIDGRGDTRADLIQALDQLSVQHREVLTLHYIQDLPVETVAARLEVPPGTVKSRLHAARRALRGLLEVRDS